MNTCIYKNEIQKKDLSNKIWFCLIPAMLIPFAASVFYFNILDGKALAKHIYALSKLFIFIWPVLCVFFIIKTPVDFKALLRFKAKPVFLGLFWGAFIFTAAFIFLHFHPFASAAQNGAEAVKSKALNFGVMEHYFLYSVFISFFHSLLEEYYWRWFVFGRLLKVMGRVGAILLSASAFGLHHFIICNFYFSLGWALFLTLCVITGGIIFNILYEKEKTLISPWLAHMGADLAIMYAGYLIIFANI
ncbi:Abortive infection protein [Elusimicrobium minutum Pei191]|uniref:Abortive infection protein n=1 Tax=Elusimicrobium minutum (strain Pei191) TaxID=445932 RepID=B2KCU3_ELUMP|nr:CPBP family intramembrane glutamic endopeptidase [Elusimicrobium minutum]ACC98339.1 Abortive infection protein [Elusimicrobium minutum Pei191]